MRAPTSRSSRSESGDLRVGRIDRRVRFIAAGIALVLLVATGCGADQDSGRHGPEAATNATVDPSLAVPGAPPEVAEHDADWPLPGRDYANSRAVLDSPISKATIDRLEVAWSTPLEGPGSLGNSSTTPIILGETIYIQDLSSNIRAFDRSSGKLRWERRYDQSQIGPSGVAVGWDKAFATKGSREIVALDRATGQELWATLLPQTETEGISIQPQVYGDLVLASTVPISLNGLFVGGDRGTLFALKVDTGEIAWSFDTIEGDGVWGNPINSGGGSWYPPAVDPEAGRVYWGTGNPSPFPGTPEFPNATSRPGDNLYTNSVLAIVAASGQLDWYNQASPHDLFDHDLQLTAIATVGEGDETRQVIIGAGKAGRIIGHDPVSGEVLFDTKVGVHENDTLTELTGPTRVLPGTYGGILTPPAVAEGKVYAALNNAPSTLSPDEPHYLGGDLGTMDGEVVAVDASNGAVLWSTKVPGDPLGGTLVLSDLVITGTYQGVLYALDRATGEIVWTQELPADLTGINGWPAATADGDLVWPIGAMGPSQLVTFRLREE